jgi:nucleoid-associated protein YgaU
MEVGLHTFQPSSKWHAPDACDETSHTAHASPKLPGSQQSWLMNGQTVHKQIDISEA